MPLSCAMLDTASISKTSIRGLPIVSAKINFVFSLIAALKFSGSSGFTKLTLMPNFLNVTANKL